MSSLLLTKALRNGPIYLVRVSLLLPILDRLLHHAAIVNIRGPSYRMKNMKKSGLYPDKGDEKLDNFTPGWGISHRGNWGI